MITKLHAVIKDFLPLVTIERSEWLRDNIPDKKTDYMRNLRLYLQGDYKKVEAVIANYHGS